MQFTFSASGTPSEVRESVNQQAKAAARGNPSTWPAAAAVRDYVSSALSGLPDDRAVTVNGSVSLVMTGIEREPAAGSVTSVATGTVPVEGKAVAVVGEDRVVATDPAETPAAYPAPDESVAPGSTAAALGRRTGDRR